MAYTTIDDPSKHFQITLWTGDGSTDHSITNGGNSNLQPDLVWIKKRNDTDDNIWADTSRGATKYLVSDNANTEQTYSGNVKSFDSDGFTVGDGNQINEGSDTFVGWQWKANGGTRTTNTESGDNPGGGYQANTTAGFSIVDYTGTGATGTMAHGLGAVPHVMIVKCRSVGHHWQVYHHKNTSAPETDALKFNDSNTSNDQDYWWNDTAPTSSVFTLGNGDSGLNDDGATNIAYLFTEIQGYSKFGSYTGSGNADGVFNYTGFQPAWVMVKQTTTANRDWRIVDNARDTYNLSTTELKPNTTGAETTSGMQLDLLANGFKIRTTSTACNSSSDTYIYMAFAEHPFVSSEGVPCTAR